MVSIVANALNVRLGGRTVLHDVSVQLEGGSFVGVLGPNGAGKSTLVRALLGLVRTSGEILLDGQALASISRVEIARRIAYLPQGQALHWPLSVERLIALGRLPHLAPLARLGEADRSAIARAMTRAEVGHLAARDATLLSGGERARVLLARALAVEAPVLIADEPLANLDPAHQIQGMELLRGEARAGGLAIAVMHDLTLAARFCDRVVVLAGGALIADGTPSSVLTPDLLARVYGVTAFVGDGSAPLLVPLDRVR